MMDIFLLIFAWLLVGCGIAWALGRATDCATCGMKTVADLDESERECGVASSRCVACIQRQSSGWNTAGQHQHAMSVPAKRLIQ